MFCRSAVSVLSSRCVLTKVNPTASNFKQKLYFSNSNQLFSKNKFYSAKVDLKTKSTLYYLAAAGVLVVGLSYAAVPLYRIFCQAYSYGGATAEASGTDVEKLKKVKHREITVKFNADVSSSMKWNFRPQQVEIKVFPGETALAFYTAKNPTDKPVIGISTYNVVPFEAGQYFNKIQCFCFEEQMLNPHEEVDMPVFFYIDSEFADDPKMEYVDDITLSYTFFEAKPGLRLPVPGYAQQHYSKPTTPSR
ncbi:cytochrome c oxidase assembly protein COX11, mitochondrial [Macrosteles quadrilineatus]|uniref:cytochrome c oxidase assembly protein COX11, mitochondrial n=1 Tax=Macrosteles quadrilineatus TaxID=74068 RepID=UPI0023E13F4C|nr:cytochrome c oxidase assembly protein COX11, mitochondrial [Macrosteles quadrilineatus]